MQDSTDKIKATDVNELFLDYLDQLDRMDIAKRELIDSFPCYVGFIHIGRFLCLFDLYKKIVDLPGHIADVGTYRGASLMFFGKLIRLFEPYSETRAHGFDWFEGMKPGAEDNPEIAGGHKGDFQHLTEIIRLQGLEDTTIVHKMDIVSELAPFLDDNPHLRFKLVFMDCGVHDVMMEALSRFWPRLVQGGILVMDHYNNANSPSESGVLERFIDGEPIHHIPYTRQPTAYVVKRRNPAVA